MYDVHSSYNISNFFLFFLYFCSPLSKSKGNYETCITSQHELPAPVNVFHSDAMIPWLLQMLLYESTLTTGKLLCSCIISWLNNHQLSQPVNISPIHAVITCQHCLTTCHICRLGIIHQSSQHPPEGHLLYFLVVVQYWVHRSHGNGNFGSSVCCTCCYHYEAFIMSAHIF